MCCPTEERMIRNRLEGMEGIDDLDFNLISRTLTVTHALPDEKQITSAIAALGMKAVSADPKRPRGAQKPAEETPFWQRPGTILTVVSGIGAIAAETLAIAIDEEHLAVRILAAVAVLAGGYETFPRAWASLRSLTFNIHFLMSVAAVGAIILGEWAEAGMVIFLFAVAELVESRSIERARRAISGLMELAPPRALTLRGLGWESVDVEEVELGEIVRIKPGERLPLDGVVRHGLSSVNQAQITGESIPVEKGKGDTVFAGSINGTGTFDYEVTHVAADSTLSQISRLVEQAGRNKAQAERFVDRFARYYTPIVLVAAVLIAIVPPLFLGGIWADWIYKGLVVLVIGCPCALVISTPVTVVSGLAAAARRGILIKGGAVLERGRDLKVIALDKTGTLTEGRPRVVDLVEVDGLAAEQILHLAAAVELQSEHPIASAIVSAHHHQHGWQEDATVSGFNSITGRGASAVVDGETIFVGNHRLAHEMGVCSGALEARLETLEAEGKTTVVVMTTEKALGIIGVADTVRDASTRAIEELHALGVRTALFTGDNATTARSIARGLGIDDVRADLLPADKIVALESLRAEHGAIGMVGDGINDVPALAHAEIGFAMGVAGTDVALEAADVALMEDNLLKLPEFIRLSRRVIQVLWQNIAIALVLKFLFFVLALMGEATLWMAVFADMGASLIVVFNGLKLLKSGQLSRASG